MIDLKVLEKHFERPLDLPSFVAFVLCRETQKSRKAPKGYFTEGRKRPEFSV